MRQERSLLNADMLVSTQTCHWHLRLQNSQEEQQQTNKQTNIVQNWQTLSTLKSWRFTSRPKSSQCILSTPLSMPTGLLRLQDDACYANVTIHASSHWSLAIVDKTADAVRSLVFQLVWLLNQSTTTRAQILSLSHPYRAEAISQKELANLGFFFFRLNIVFFVQKKWKYMCYLKRLSEVTSVPFEEMSGYFCQ